MSCKDCKFKDFQLNGVIPGYLAHVKICSFPKHHSCYYLSRCSEILRENLSSVQFFKCDYVLKRRLYELSFPVIRRKLWLSSKQCSNLGKKPKVYLTKSIQFYSNDDKTWTSKKTMDFTDDMVIEAKFMLTINDFMPGNLKYLSRFMEFNNWSFSSYHCELNFDDLKSVCNSNLYSISLSNTPINSTIISKLLPFSPNLMSIACFDHLNDGWENDLLKLKSKLKRICLSPKRINNFEILADLCRNGTRINFLGHPIFDMDELKKYFRILNKDDDAFNQMNIVDLDTVVCF